VNRRAQLRSALLALGGLTSACSSTTLSEAGKRTTVLNDVTYLSTCQDLGAVTGDGVDRVASGSLEELKSPKGGGPSGGADFAIVDLRNAAGKRGATHVRVLDSVPGQVTSNKSDNGTLHTVHLDGRAYQCSP
jgi:hypothetical protein